MTTPLLTGRNAATSCISRIALAIVVAYATLLPSATHAAQDTTEFDIFATKQSSTAGKVQWHGYYEFEYWDDESKKSSFDAHKITIWMGLPINDKVWLSSEIEYEHFPRLNDDGTQANGGDGTIKVDSAQLRFSIAENFTPYVGIFYVPFGIEHLRYPGQKNKMVTRPKVMKGGGIIPGTWSDVGVGFNSVFNGIGQIDLFYVNGDANNGGVSRDSSTGGNEGKSLGLRFMLDGFADGFNIGGSYVNGKYDSGNVYDSTRWGAHLLIDSGKLFGSGMSPLFIAEYVTGKDENGSSVSGEDKNVSGYYAQLSLSVHPLAELAVRYGQYDDDGKVASNNKTETSLGVVVHAMDNIQLKGEYQLNGEEGTETDNDVLVFQIVAFW